MPTVFKDRLFSLSVLLEYSPVYISVATIHATYLNIFWVDVKPPWVVRGSQLTCDARLDKTTWDLRFGLLFEAR